MPVCVYKQVIVRKDNKIRLYCKGADNIIFERLNASCADLKELTTHHLNVSALCAHQRLFFHTCSCGCDTLEIKTHVDCVQTFPLVTFPWSRNKDPRGLCADISLGNLPMVTAHPPGSIKQNMLSILSHFLFSLSADLLSSDKQSDILLL